jgi:hypothetical protein
VQGVQVTSATSLSVYAQNTGTGTVTINGMILKDSTGNTVQTASAVTGTPGLVSGVLSTVTGTFTTVSSGQYTITLTTAKGGSFVSSSFVVS